jgi:hypothetical protein
VFLLFAASAAAADLHPIVDLQSGYLFGASSGGKWIKAEDAAKVVAEGTTYRVYGLIESLGEVKGGKPESAGAPCDETLLVSLSPKV